VVHSSVEHVRSCSLLFRLAVADGDDCRCLQLWEQENSLDEAISLGRRLLQVVDTMNSLWDCPGETSPFFRCVDEFLMELW